MLEITDQTHLQYTEALNPSAHSKEVSMKSAVVKLSALALLIVGITGSAGAAFVAPEIDATMGVNALALLGGAILVIRSAHRK
jgi:hypothetical protein